jgi:hypothetical protein
MNKDKSSSVIPSLKLVDAQGREYDESSNGFYVTDYLSPMKSVNPDIMTSGYLVFDVPPKRKYSLKLSGGLTSGEYAFVDLP